MACEGVVSFIPVEQRAMYYCIPDIGILCCAVVRWNPRARTGNERSHRSGGEYFDLFILFFLISFWSCVVECGWCSWLSIRTSPLDNLVNHRMYWICDVDVERTFYLPKPSACWRAV